MTRLAAAAFAYAANGWAVFPCKPGKKAPLTRHGCKDATEDRGQIESWWRRWPDANIGVATGHASGIYVLDVDGPEGLDALAGLAGRIPATLTQATPSGGWHFVFHHPAGKLGNTARSLGDQLDTRGDGGYILVPPSVVGGNRYRWVTRREPAQMPGWLIRAARPLPPKPKPAPKIDDDERADRYAMAALRGEVDAVSAAGAGTRNDTLNAAAIKLGSLVAIGALDGDLVFRSLLEAAEACGHVRDDGERMARKTIQSGMSYGMQHPRAVAS